MPISEEAQLNVDIQNEFGMFLNPELKYSTDQLREIYTCLKDKKEYLTKNVKKCINEATNACMGGELEYNELSILVQKIVNLVFSKEEK